MAKYLDSTGLSVLWNKIKNKLTPATTSEAGLMSAFDKSALDTLKTVFNNTKSFIPDSLEATQYSDNVHFELTGKVFNDEGNYDSDGVQVTINAATSTSAGVMSANDKVALDKATTFESTFPQYITGLYWVRRLAVQEATDGIHLKTAEYQHANNKLVITSTDGYINLPFASSTNGGFMTSTDKTNLDNVVTELPNKANISDIPDIEVKRILDDDTFENVDSVTREDIKKDLFDDLWKEAVGTYGDVDHTHVEDGVSKPYYLNELWLTYDEALAVYEACVGWHRSVNGNQPCGKLSYTNIKTTLPIYYCNGDGQMDFGGFCQNNEYIESIRLVRNAYNNMTRSLRYFCNLCTNLKHIYGEIILTFNAGIDHCLGTPKLETVYLRNLCSNIDLKHCPKISLDSFIYMIQYSKTNTSDINKDITITVHPEVYSKLTNITNTEWNALLTAAAAKNITFATA